MLKVAKLFPAVRVLLCAAALITLRTSAVLASPTTSGEVEAEIAELQALSPAAVTDYRAAIEQEAQRFGWWKAEKVYWRVLRLAPDFDAAARRQGGLIIRTCGAMSSSASEQEKRTHHVRRLVALGLLERAVGVRRSSKNLGALAQALWWEWDARAPSHRREVLVRILELAEEATSQDPTDARTLYAGVHAGCELSRPTQQGSNKVGLLGYWDRWKIDRAASMTTRSVKAAQAHRLTPAALSLLWDALELQARVACDLGRWKLLQRTVDEARVLSPKRSLPSWAEGLSSRSPTGWLRKALKEAWNHDPTASRIALEVFLGIGFVSILLVVARRAGLFAGASSRQLTALGEVASVVTACVVLPFVLMVMLRSQAQRGTDSLVITILGQAVLFAVVGGLLRRRKCVVRPKESSLLAQGLAGCMYGIGLIAAGFAIAALLSLVGVDPSGERALLRLLVGSGLDVRLLVTLVFLGPLGEEILFRGYAFERLAPEYGRVTAYALSSLAFAVAHGSLAGAPVYAVYGVILGRAYESRRSLLTAFVAHALNNTFALGMTLQAASIHVLF